MAGARGNVAWIAFQKQTAKGTPAVISKTKAVRSGVTSGVISPVREIARLSETDASRDQGIAYVKKDALKGNPDIYVRPTIAGAVLLGVLGEDEAKEEVSKTHWEHKLKVKNTLPYWTFWTMLNEGAGGTNTELWEEHENCIIASAAFKCASGSPMTCTLDVMGTKTKRLEANPLAAEDPGGEAGAPFNFNNIKVEKFGHLTGEELHTISSFDMTINNKGTEQQTDKTTPYDIVVGKREITFGFELFFENLKEYNWFHYGAEKGTTISSSIYETEIEVAFEIAAEEVIKLTIPKVAYEEFPLQPNAEGNPIVVAVKGVAQRPANPATEEIIKTVVKNTRATY